MMTNKEKYKQAFSVLHASNDISMEVNKMKKTKKSFHIRPAVAACIAAFLLCGMTAYAVDLGGIREVVQSWFHGKQVAVDVTDNGDGGYTFSYEEDGETQEVGGGGVAINEDGTTTALSAKEVADQMAVDISRDDDGSVWLYYYDQSFNITDYLEKGICKVAISDKGKMVYFDIEDNGGGGYAFSQSKDPTGAKEDYTVI
ncbi:MAG: hypothetical protein PHE06_11765 [Lachnospiraceae bacterium]|nr:hypothetical protein [Lachnospiraceae bacterium]MDD3796619.1 hypothetical protein [Lachnospiraceae bacterium]